MCRALFVVTGGTSVGKSTAIKAMQDATGPYLKAYKEIAAEVIAEKKMNPKLPTELHAFQLEINQRLIQREFGLVRCLCSYVAILDRDIVDALVYTEALPNPESLGHSPRKARSLRRQLNKTRRYMKWLLRKRQNAGKFRAVFFFEPLGKQVRNEIAIQKDVHESNTEMNPLLIRGYTKLMPGAPLVLVPSRTKDSGAKKALALLPGTCGALSIEALDGATRSRRVKAEERAKKVRDYISRAELPPGSKPYELVTGEQ